MRISNKYLIEFIVFSNYVLFAMAWVGATAYMPQIMEKLTVTSLASASLISGSVTVAKIIGTFVAAAIIIKLGVKHAFSLSAALVAIGFLTPLAGSYEMLLVSRFLMGLGGALMVVYFNPIVLTCFSAKERSIVNGLNAVAFNVGTAIILWFVSDLTALFGSWQNTLIAFSILSLVFLALWLMVLLPAQAANSAHQQHQAYGYKQGLRDKFNWVYALSYSGILSFYICLFTFYPQAGISQSKWVIGCGIIGTLAGIVYSQKIPQRVPVIKYSGLLITLSLAAMTWLTNPILVNISSMLLGFFVFLPIAALVTLPQELKEMTTQRITIIFSIFYSVSYSVATALLWIFGALVDHNNGDFSMSFTLIIIASSTLFLGSFLLPETAKLVNKDMT